MSILDDAIREHLELKRRHGARESDLKQLEDEAFGDGDLADPFASASPTSREAQAEEESTSSPSSDEIEQPETPPPPGPATPAPESAFPGAEDPTMLVRPSDGEQQEEADSGIFDAGEMLGGDAAPEAEEPGEPDVSDETDAAGDPEASFSEPSIPPPPESESASRPGGEAASIVDMPTEEHPPPSPEPDPLDAGASAPGAAPQAAPESDDAGDVSTDDEPAGKSEPLEGEEFFEDDYEDFESGEYNAVSEEAPAPPAPPEPSEPEPEDDAPADSGGVADFAADFDDEPADDDPVEDEDEDSDDEPEEELPAGDAAADEADDDGEPDLEDSPGFSQDEGEDLWFEKKPPKDFDFEE